MDFEFSFDDFATELQDFEIKRTKKFDRIWRWSSGGSIDYHVLHEGVAYFGAMDSYVYAFNVETGKELWRFKTKDRIFGSLSNVYKDMICVPSFDAHVYCLDTRTGKEIWRFKTGDMIFGSPRMYKDRAFFGSKDGFFYCLDLKGNLLWNFKTGDTIASAPTFQENMVIFGSFDGYVYCLYIDSGVEKWRFKTGGEVSVDLPSPVHNGVLYITSFDNYLYAIDVEKGFEIWRFRTGKFGNCSYPAIMNNKLFVGSRDGFVYCLAMDGKELWRFKAGGIVIGLSTHNGKIYFTSEDGHMYVLEESGKEVMRFKFGRGGSFDYPSFHKGKIIVGSIDCHLYVIDENTGKEVWRFATSSTKIAKGPPPHEEFEVQMKIQKSDEEAEEEEGYVNVPTDNFLDRSIKSEYSVKSEYKQESEYK